MKITFAIIAVAIAITTAVSIPAEAARPQFSKNREEFKNDIREQRQEEIRDKREQVRSHVAGKHADRLEKRFAIYQDRLNNIIAKIQNRLDKLAGEGKDTSAAQTKLDEAKVKLNEVKSMADRAILIFQAIDPAEFKIQRENAKAARNSARETRLAFKEVIDLLHQTVQLLQ